MAVAHEGILEAAAVAVPDANSGEAVKLFVVRRGIRPSPRRTSRTLVCQGTDELQAPQACRVPRWCTQRPMSARYCGADAQLTQMTAIADGTPDFPSAQFVTDFALGCDCKGGVSCPLHRVVRRLRELQMTRSCQRPERLVETVSKQGNLAAYRVLGDAGWVSTDWNTLSFSDQTGG
ncbi:MAG: hypothetical protein R3D32_03440 [Nitratireductor sp.]